MPSHSLRRGRKIVEFDERLTFFVVLSDTRKGEEYVAEFKHVASCIVDTI